MNRRTALLAAGTAAAAVGLALAFAPGVAAAPSLSPDAPLLVGALAVAAGAVRARALLRADAGAFDLPDPERARPVAVPGAAFDDLLADLPETPVAGDQRRLKVRRDLRRAAVAALTRCHGVEPDAAEEMLEAGTWTDDPLAAELFATPDGTGRSLRSSVLASVGARDPFYRRADRASREIARLAGGDPP